MAAARWVSMTGIMLVTLGDVRPSMVATNELLSIGFGIIASFTNIVRIPSDAVPTKPDDLKKYVVGSPRSPVDLLLVHRDGTRFWITDGAVSWFCTPGSYR